MIGKTKLLQNSIAGPRILSWAVHIMEVDIPTSILVFYTLLKVGEGIRMDGSKVYSEREDFSFKEQ